MKKFALIVAGGSGSRMNKNVPKQFLEINSRPILMHTFDAFKQYDQQIDFVVILPKAQVEFWKSLCKKHKFEVQHKIAFGGETRFDSVKNGLELIAW